MPGKVVLVFARAPQAGKAKTRLIPALGAANAAALHAGLVERALQTACGTGAPVQLWCTPDTGHNFFQHCASRHGCDLHKQRGADLGSRMSHALSTVLEYADHAILTGSDCPTLTGSDIEQAFAALAAGADVVLGPAADGGYYLVGLSRPQPHIFAGIDWGTPQVLSQTRGLLRQSGLTEHLLAVRADLDTPEDLPAFPDHRLVMQRGQRLVELDR